MTIRNYMRAKGTLRGTSLAAGLCLLCFLAGPACSRPAQEAGPASDTAPAVRLHILTSFFPLWCFTKNIVGDDPAVQIDILIPPGRSPHDYQLTPGDLRRINQAELFIVNGYFLEEFLEDAIKKTRPDLKVVRAGEAVPPIAVAEDHEEPEAGHAGHHHEGGINPHPFASPTDAALMVRAIAEALVAADPAHADRYRQNAEAYVQKLLALGEELKAVVSSAPNKKIMTFHNAFDYLARATGLEIVGAIETVPGQEPSAGELSRLAQRARDRKVVAIYSEPQSSPRLAETLGREAGVPVAELDPGHTGEPRPDAYETIMRKNLDTLRLTLVGSGR